MRHFVFALTVFLSAATIAEAAAMTRAPAASTNDVILAQSTDDDSPNFYSGNNRDRQRRARFVCVITPRIAPTAVGPISARWSAAVWAVPAAARAWWATARSIQPGKTPRLHLHSHSCDNHRNENCWDIAGI